MSKFEILQNNSANKEVAILNKNIDEQRLLDHKKHAFEHIAFNIPDQTVMLLKLFVYFSIWILVIKGEESLENLLLYVWLLTYVDTTIKAFRWWVVKMIVKKYSAIQALWDLFDSVPKVEWYDTWSNFEMKIWAVEMNNVTFSYDLKNKSKPVLKDLTLSIEWWKKTALVWVSWSGKSTLVKLITWYLKPDSWSVLVDGQDLNKVAMKTYYKHIGYLTQEPSVFDWTVFDNLTYAVDSDVSDEKLKKVIELAKCEFIYDFPDGLETEIWERWIRLSGWQRQRLAIAKVFLKDPEIIVLDEPTSALDSFSEEAITEAMHNLFTGRTVIIIAHRLQTVKEADDIIVIEEWRVVERGTNDELVRLDWSYAKMLRLQSGF